MSRQIPLRPDAVAFAAALTHNDDESALAIWRDADQLQLARDLATLAYDAANHNHADRRCAWDFERWLRWWGQLAAAWTVYAEREAEA